MSTAQNPTPQPPPVRITTYREAHRIYREAGWTGPLPLPRGVKTPPPDGWTGWHGAYPSYADSEAWCDPHDYGDTHQTALRMADGVVGIDVDHYGTKCGADTIAEAVRRWGPLPLAPSSSARGAGPSGIRFLRVPPGTVLRTAIGFPELGLGGVEIIQRHHRYAMVWPSTNPQVGGAPYLWRDTDSPFAPPRVAGLPHLPDAWIEANRSTGEPGEAAADPETVTAFSRDHGDADGSASLAGPVAIFKRGAASGRSRHDAMLDAACMAAREARAGAYPAAQARTVLCEEFILALAEARAGQRLVSPAAARREFESLWGWAVGQALAMSVGECRARIKWQEPAEPLGPPSPASAPTDAGAGPSGDEAGGSDPGPGESSGEATEDEGETPDAEEIRRRRHKDAVDERLRHLRAEAEARRILAAEARAHRVRIADGLVDDLDSIKPPEMLMDSLIPEGSIGFLAGRSGAYKSFLATAWACCIATGRPWLGESRFAVRRPLRVLYVAAEGAAGAAGRIRAWERASGVSRRGRLTLYPRPIHLNDPAQVEELIAVIVEHGFEFVVIDTYHRSAPGTEENSSTDFGTVYEVVASLRDDHGCSSLFVDHTGNAGKTGNPRGTSAKRDDADYILSASYLGEEAVGEAQRELFVTKLKDEDTAGRWPIRLAPVDGEHFPVVEIGTVGDSDVLRNQREWWTPDNCPEIPDDVLKAIEAVATQEHQGGRGVEQAKWVWRLLSSVNDENGLTNEKIKSMFQQAPPTARFSEERIRRGIALLAKTSVAERPTKATIALSQ